MAGHTHRKSTLVICFKRSSDGSGSIFARGGTFSESPAPDFTRYLAFQIFSGAFNQDDIQHNFPGRRKISAR